MPNVFTPEQGVHQRIWTSMRVMRVFTVGELVAATEVKEGTVKAYCARLCRCGFLHKGKPNKRRPGGQQVTYRLVLDRGPRWPRMRYQRGVASLFDPNTNKHHPMRPVETAWEYP